MKFKELEPQESNFPRVKLADKESVRGVFRGDPVDFRQHWREGRPTTCKGRAACQLCQAGERSSFRFEINFITKEGEHYVAKAFGGPRQVYEDLAELAKDYDLSNHLVKISRSGTDKNTRYSIMPIPKGELSAEQLKAITALPLLELGADSQAGAKEEQDANEDIAF